MPIPPVGVTFASVQALGPAAAIEVARRAEALAYRSFWTAEVTGPEAFATLGAVSAVALRRPRAPRVPGWVERARRGGAAGLSRCARGGVCPRPAGGGAPRRDLFGYAVVDAYAQNFERAGYADVVAAVRERHAAGDRAGA